MLWQPRWFQIQDPVGIWILALDLQFLCTMCFLCFIYRRVPGCMVYDDIIITLKYVLQHIKGHSELLSKKSGFWLFRLCRTVSGSRIDGGTGTQYWTRLPYFLAGAIFLIIPPCSPSNSLPPSPPLSALLFPASAYQTTPSTPPHPPTFASLPKHRRLSHPNYFAGPWLKGILPPPLVLRLFANLPLRRRHWRPPSNKHVEVFTLPPEPDFCAVIRIKPCEGLLKQRWSLLRYSTPVGASEGQKRRCSFIYFFMSLYRWIIFCLCFSANNYNSEGVQNKVTVLGDLL